VRVVRGAEDALPVGVGKTGCVPVLLACTLGLAFAALKIMF
jgi:hypothetical protein